MSKYSKAKKNLKKNRITTNSNPVKISLNDSQNVISPFAENDQKVISGDFATFLDNAVKDVPIKEDLTLEITTKKYDHDTISTAIKNYYYNDFIETDRQLKNNLIFSLLTLLIGTLGFVVMIVLKFIGQIAILQDVLTIFSWVFIWESFDLFFFRRTELKHLQARQMNFINAKVVIK